MITWAADLHLHSRHAGGVSSAMTVDNIARVAQRKGLDLLGTGDGLQAEWLDEIEAGTIEAEPGLLKLRPEVEARVASGVPAGLRRSLRYVVSAEVSCAPPGTPPLGGIHHLVYFPSVEQARRFRERMKPHGDLREGRPELALTSRALLAEVLEFDPRCRLAPAHVFNPWYSLLGTVSGGRTPADTLGDLAGHVMAVETGLTSTPAMCRRVSALDAQALFSNSDAHSLDNIGRECSLVELEVPSYDAVMRALAAGRLTGTVKFPVERTRYYLNRCGVCRRSFEGRRCPQCGRALVTGVRDRLEMIADRAEPVARDAPFMQVLPLAHVLAEQMGATPSAKPVQAWVERLLDALGNERHILTEAAEDEIAEVSTLQLARAIVRQRTEAPRRLDEDAPAEERQLGLEL